MEHALRMEVQSDGTVATLLDESVMDTDTEWRAQVGNRPVLILARMLAAMVAWADQYGADLVMPGPEALAALEAHK